MAVNIERIEDIGTRRPGRIFRYLWPKREDFDATSGPDGEPYPDCLTNKVEGGTAWTENPNSTGPLVVHDEVNQNYIIGSAETYYGLNGAQFKTLMVAFSDLILTLGLCGYHVPYIELAVDPWFNYSGAKDARVDRIIRVDLTGDYPRVYVTPRDAASGTTGFVRLGLERMIANYEDASMPVSADDLAAYRADLPSIMTEKLFDFAARSFQIEGVSEHLFGPGSTRNRTVGEMISGALGPLEGLETKDEIELSLIELKANYASEINAENLNVLNGDLLIEAIRAEAIDPVTMFLSRRIADIGAEFFGNPTPPDGLAPHGLWVLDPANWAIGAAAYDFLFHEETDLPENDFAEYMMQVFGGLRAALSLHAFVSADGKAASSSGQSWDPPDDAKWTQVPDAAFFGPGLTSSRYFEPGTTLDPAMATQLPRPIAHFAIQRMAFGTEDLPSRRRRAKTPFDPNVGSSVLHLLDTYRCLELKLDLAGPRLSRLRLAKEVAQKIEVFLLAFESPDKMPKRFALRDVKRSPALRLAFYLFDQGIFTINHILGFAEIDDDTEPPPYDLVATWTNDTNIHLRLPDVTRGGLHIHWTDAELPYDMLDAVAWRYIPAAVPLDDTTMNDLRAQVHEGLDKPRVIVVAAPGIDIDHIDEWPNDIAPLQVIRLQDQADMPAMGEPISPETLIPPSTVGLTDLVDLQTLNSITEDPDEQMILRRAAGLYIPLDTSEFPTDELGEPIDLDEVDPSDIPAEPSSLEAACIAVRHVDKGAFQGVELRYIARTPTLLTGYLEGLGDQFTSLFSSIGQLYSGQEWEYPWAQADHRRHWVGEPGDAVVQITVPAGSGIDRFAYSFEPYIETHVVSGNLPGPLELSPLGQLYLQSKGRARVIVKTVKYRLVIHATQNVKVEIIDGRYTPAIDNVMDPATYVMDYRVYRPDPKHTGSVGLTEIAPCGQPLNWKTGSKRVSSEWLEMGAWGADFRESKDKLVFDRQPLEVNATFQTNEWMKFAADMAIGFIPIVGDLTDAVELSTSLLTGTDKWGQPMTWMQRGMMVAGALLPIVSSKALGAAANAVNLNLADEVIGEIDDVIDGGI